MPAITSLSGDNNDIIEELSSIKDNDAVSFSIPIDGHAVDVSGIATIDEKGNIVVKTDPFVVGDFSFESGTLTINKKNGNFDANNIDIVIDGVGKYGEITSNLNDFEIKINGDRVTIENPPIGVKSGTFLIPEQYKFAVQNGANDLASVLQLAQNSKIGRPSSFQSSSYGSGGGGGGQSKSRNSSGNNNRSSSKSSTITAAADEAKFVAKNHDEYWNAEFQSILDNTADVDYDHLAQQLKSDVDYLKTDFAKVKDKMNGWIGSASESAKITYEAILNKFECTFKNITESVGPACTKIETFKETLEKLKKGKEELTGSDGNGGLDKELKDLTKDYEDKKAKYDNLKSNEPSTTRTVTNDAGKKVKEHNPDYDSWKTNLSNAEKDMNSAKELMEGKQKEVKAKEEELDLLLEDAKETYKTIKELVSQVNTFKDYLGNGSKSNYLSSASSALNNFDKISKDFGTISLVDYSDKSKAVLADSTFFEQACKEHAKEGWSIDGNIVTMVIDGKKCQYDMKKHTFTEGKNKTLEAYFYLPSDIVKSGDYSKLSSLNTYTFFTSKEDLYVNTIDNRDINTVTVKIVKRDPLNNNYDTVTDITKAANKAAGTDLSICQNIIGGDSVYGAHSLKLAAYNGDLYKTVYCVDNAAIVTGENGRARTKEQFNSIDELKGLDGKNVYFISASGDDNYAYGAVGPRAYTPVSRIEDSFTYTGIELVAKNCPNAKVHIVYQDQDTQKESQRTTNPAALDALASRYSNLTNDSKKWDEFAAKKYKYHSQGNYIPHDLASADSTIYPVSNT